MTQLNFARDINGFNTFGPSFADDNQQVALAANTEKTVTAPTESSEYLAVFAYEPGAKVWVAPDATATVPGSSFAATPCQLNPAARYIESGTVLHFITDDTTAQVGVSFYAITL